MGLGPEAAAEVLQHAVAPVADMAGTDRVAGRRELLQLHRADEGLVVRAQRDGHARLLGRANTPARQPQCGQPSGGQLHMDRGQAKGIDRLGRHGHIGPHLVFALIREKVGVHPGLIPHEGTRGRKLHPPGRARRKAYALEEGAGHILSSPPDGHAGARHAEPTPAMFS